MKIKTRSILQELNAIADRKDSEAIIESRAANILNSAIDRIQIFRQGKIIKKKAILILKKKRN